MKNIPSIRMFLEKTAKIILLYIIILLSSSKRSPVSAQTFDFKSTEASDIVTGDQLYQHGFPDTLTAWCNDWYFITSNPTTWGNDLLLKENNAFVKFYVNNYSKITKYMGPVQYDYRLAYRLRGYTDPNDTVWTFSTDADTLNINFNNDAANSPFQDLNFKKYSKYYKMQVELLAIVRDSVGFIVPVLLGDTTVRNFAVEASILTQHYDKKEYGSGPPSTVPIITDAPHPAEQYIDLSWNFSTGSLTPVNYELEWTYVDDYNVSVPGGVESPISFFDLRYDFARNNTRVWLNENSYRIPLIYPRGYIVYRVRAVRPDSIYYKYPVYGDWTILDDEGSLSGLSSGVYYNSAPYKNDSLNWQYTTSFTEGGKYKNVVTFFDGLLKNRQSITRFNTNLNKLIATGNVYDYEGRLAIRSLPAPINVPSFTYQYNLLLNSVTSLPYQASDFDTGSMRLNIIAPLAANALANEYYSISNPDTFLRYQKFIADAEGYPIMQTVYESASRVLAQGGAGSALQVGSSNYNLNSYVGTPQSLVNSLFGPNVGWSSFYNMTVSQDANQQNSMSIKDYHGNVMVSALVGNGPSSSTHAIDLTGGNDSNYTRMDLLAPSSRQAIDRISGIKVADVDYFSEAHTADSIQYSYSFTPYEACPGLFLSVGGSYSVVVTDKYGVPVLTDGNSVGTSGVGTSSTPITYAGPVSYFPADVGTYHVNKKLSYSVWDIDAVLDSFFKVANCFHDEPYFIKQSVTATPFPCPGDVPGAPAYDSDDCMKKKWEMMQQLFPNAIYGKYSVEGGVMASVPNSIYTIFCHCYHAFAIYGEDTSLVVSSQGTRGIVNYRAPFTEVVIRDTCTPDTFFTENITIKAFGLFDSTHSIYMPFMGENGVIGDTAMVGYYRITSNWNLGSANGTIYSGGVAVGTISQHPAVDPSLFPDTTFITLPITVSGINFSADIHGNILAPGGDSVLFTFSGVQVDPYPHEPASTSPYVDWSSAGCLARYQDTCLLPDFPDTITVNGVFHAGLRTMDHMHFNSIYSEAVASGNYSLAEAMLPLHPQYCELMNCFTDTFKSKLTAITNWQTAEGQHLLHLDDLVAQDPLKDYMLASGLFPSPADSLLTFKGGTIRLDSFVFISAYCASGDSLMFAHCFNDMFNYEITNHLLINDEVKKYYYESVANLYLGNRQRFVDSILNHGGASCAPCSAKRMELNGRPIFFVHPHMDTPLVEFAGGDELNWVATVFTDSLNNQADSVTAWNHKTDSVFGAASIDTIMSHLANCFDPLSSTATSVRSALELLVSNGEVEMGNFTQEQIYGVLHDASISIDDICNPYVFNFSRFGKSTTDNPCMPASFYDNIASFLADPTVGGVLQAIGSSGSYTLDTVLHTVDREIARRLGNIEHVDVSADFDAARELYTLYFVPSGGGSDTVKMFLHVPACADIFSMLSPGAYTATASCPNATKFSRFSSVGLINQYSFVAKVKQGIIKCQIIGWIDSVRTMGAADGELVRCIPCTQMRELYTEFKDTLQVYGIKGADHPLYASMLANFMNDALSQQFSYFDYETFIQSCALADSVEMPLYIGYSTFKFSYRPDMDLFINTLNSVDPEYQFDDCYKDSINVSGGAVEITVCVDLNKVPENKLKVYRDVLSTFASSSGVPILAYVINAPLKTLHSSSEIGFIYENPSYPFSPADSGIISPATGVSFGVPYQKAIWIGGAFVMCKVYDVVQTGASPSDISRAIYNITAYLFNKNLPGVVFVPEYRSTIDNDYFKPEKQAYLKYVYDFQGIPEYDVLHNLQSQTLVANIPAYAPYNVAYTKESRCGLFTNLYLWKASMNTRYFDTLQHIIDLVSPTGAIFNTASSTSITVPAPALLNAYVASDRSYWYRYFTTGDTLFNVYLGFPPEVPAYQRPMFRVAGPVIPLPGDSLNRYFGLNVTIPGSGDTIQLFGLSSFVIGNSIELNNVIMRKAPFTYNGGVDTFDNCERQRLYGAINSGIVNYSNYMADIRASISAAFREYVATSAQEALMLGYTTNKQYFTLYNYDRAGNLTYTVPPAGLSAIPNTGSLIALVDTSRSHNTPGASPMPVYNKINTYTYTSFNKLREQVTINGGKTRFMYDAMGRLVFSQNAKQASIGALTYNLYDGQGRITETGEATFGCPYFDPYSYPTASPPASTPGCHSEIAIDSVTTLVSPFPDIILNSETQPYNNIVSFVQSTYPRRDVVFTNYDSIVNPLDTIAGFSAQQNLRKRISCVKYIRNYTGIHPNAIDYDYATYYSYDAQGNVQTLTHDYPKLENIKRRYVRIDYDYDVISGKVNMLSYNRGLPDQFYQKYMYDADNRLIEVQTSNEGYIWKRDAQYTYYDHGPLARAVLGDMRVQGLDYAYTIQGWLKTVNGDSLNGVYDIGLDGLQGGVTASDAVAHTIDYFTGDYHSITGRQVQHTAPVNRSLYNGNIVGQTVAIDTFQRLNKKYVYDQLNRILTADYATVDLATGALSSISDYKSKYGYDADGNIQSLLRVGNNIGSGAVLMDSLKYLYSSTHNDLLEDVLDSAANTYTNDLKQHTTLVAGGRYRYDEIGNLTANYESGQDTILWTLYNKVSTAVNIADTSELEYDYDGAGNRVGKRYIKVSATGGKLSKEEYYVRDAQGNILATYSSNVISNNGGTYTDFALSSHDVYGSSRIGQKKYYGRDIGGVIDYTTVFTGLFDTVRFFPHVPWYSLEYQDAIITDSTNLYGNPYLGVSYGKHVMGLHDYEVSDHLGNVLATLSDKRAGSSFVPVSGGLTPGALAMINTWKPIVTTAHDYYPFGAYMPGRYTIDTSTQCFITTYSGMGNIQLYNDMSPVSMTGYSSGVIGIVPLTMGGGVSVASPAAASGGIIVLPPTSQYGTHVDVQINSVTNNHNFKIVDNISGALLGNTLVPTMGSGLISITLAPLPHSGDISLNIECTDPSGGNVHFMTIQAGIDTLVPHNVLANVCNNDGYRYGYNGQMKDNEWAGVGNHYEYGVRHYDPRIGRFFSVDPLGKQFPWYSSYQFAGNTPIQAIDLDGKEEYHYTRIKDNSGKTTSIQLNSVKDVYELNLKATFSASLATGSWTPVYDKNPYQSHVVHQTDTKYMDNVYGLAQEVNYDESVSYPSYNVAAHGTDADFANTAADIGVMFQQGLNNVAQEVRDNGGPIVSGSAEGSDWAGPGDYSNLPNPKTVKVSGEFTRMQKRNILNENQKHNGGALRDDVTGEVLNWPVQSKKGVPADMNQAEVDHNISKKNGGTNANTNAKVRSKANNLRKGSNNGD